MREEHQQIKTVRRRCDASSQQLVTPCVVHSEVGILSVGVLFSSLVRTLSLSFFMSYIRLQRVVNVDRWIRLVGWSTQLYTIFANFLTRSLRWCDLLHRCLLVAVITIDTPERSGTSITLRICVCVGSLRATHFRTPESRLPFSRLCFAGFFFSRVRIIVSWSFCLLEDDQRMLCSSSPPWLVERFFEKPFRFLSQQHCLIISHSYDLLFPPFDEILSSLISFSA